MITFSSQNDNYKIDKQKVKFYLWHTFSLYNYVIQLFWRVLNVVYGGREKTDVPAAKCINCHKFQQY